MIKKRNRYVEAYYLKEDEELVNEKLEIENDMGARTERGIRLLLIVIIVISSMLFVYLFS